MIRRLLTVLMVSLICAVQAQVPMLPAEYLERARQIQGDTVRFCVLQDSVLTEVNEAVARLLADTLLLDARIYPVELPLHVQPLGYRLPLSAEQIFFLLNNECDAFMGYLLGSGTLADWQITTAPYLSTGFVLVTRGLTPASLRELPVGSRLGTQLGSAPNSRLSQYLRNEVGEGSWRRVPYPDNQVLLERLVDGTVDAALVWEPALEAFGASDLQVTRDLQPLPLMSADFAIAMLSSNTFLQSSLDAAIRAVSEDGSIDRLLAEVSLSGTAP